MSIRAYLPSAQFGVVAVALIFSGGIIYAAEYVAYPPAKEGASRLEASTGQSGGGTIDAQWQGAFASSTTFANDNTIAAQAQQLIQGVKTGNLTESVGRSLLINATAAQGQGLGSNSQEAIVSQALSQVQSAQSATSTSYSLSDFIVTNNSSAALRAYANELASLTTAFPQANYRTVMVAAGLAVDYHSAAIAKLLSLSAEEYRALAGKLATTPVPKVFLNVQLQATNTYVQMASACDDIAQVLTDPLKGIAGIQAYQTLNNQNVDTLTNFAQILQSEGLLFQKNESGSLWASFLQAAYAAQTQNAAGQNQGQGSSASTGSF